MLELYEEFYVLHYYSTQPLMFNIHSDNKCSLAETSQISEKLTTTEGVERPEIPPKFCITHYPRYSPLCAKSIIVITIIM